ncbi:MAG: hypothetical protein NDI66_04775 [Pseudomonas sp.]|nr:hypothetical protein [Pseudomonas sp.]
MKHGSVKHIARSALVVALALASGTAAALGLGQIEVKSRAGQPLLAEIPIISSDPAELEALQVGPASPETFSRIGLTPPQGIVADLQFTVALDSAGNPVIRVTSQQPVTQPLLTFLVEVDSIQGRLVREYSALIDTPQTVAAPLQPPVAAPVVSAPNVIERPVQAAEPLAEVAAEAPAEPASDTEAEDMPAADPVAVEETPAPEPVASVPEPAFSPSPSVDAINVERGDTLSGLAGALDLQGLSLDQAMIALLRANPDAFIGGNINQLKQGAVLRVPPSGELASVDAGEASALVRAQVRQWRQARQPAPQPVASGGGDVERSAPGQVAAAARTASARLEIVPPGASQANRAGNQSGMSAGGEGEMLRQEMQVTKETLAARDAEVQELKSRIAELEKLQQDQQQLLSMKDTELAAAQQRLAASNAATPANPADAAAGASLMPWILGGSGVLLVALLGGWLLRRRAAAAPRFRPPVETVSPLAAAFPAAASPRDDLFGAAADDVADPSPPEAGPAVAPLREPATPTLATNPAAPVADPAEGLWDRRERAQLRGGRPAGSVPDQGDAVVVPAWHAKSSATATAPGGGEQLELARAYLDLGDRDGARQLLGEVLLHGDLEARQRASRMLQELE